MSLSAALQFRQSRCTRYRYRYSECSRCADACPHGAIGLHDAGARLVAGHCEGCGLCTAACHTGSWESTSFRPIELLRRAIRQPEWNVGCAPAGCEVDDVVPCLGALPAGMLAYLARRGVAVSLHGAQHCPACPHGAQGAQALSAHLRAVAALRDALLPDGGSDWAMPVVAEGATPTRQVASAPEPSIPAATSRRRLLRRLVGRAVDELTSDHRQAPPPPPPKAIRAGTAFVPEPRELLQIVCGQAGDQPLAVPLDDALPLMELALRAGCTVCEACFRVCPTGALQIEENPDAWALTFQVDRCVACQVCLEACHARVLDAEPVVDARPERPPRVLLAMQKQRCARCDRHFVSAGAQDYCAVCADDQDAFSALFG